MEGSRKKGHPSEVRITRAKNGFIVRHSFDNANAGPSYRVPQDYAFSDHKAMMAHVHTHTAGAGASEPDADDRPAGVGRVSTRLKPGPRTYGAGVD